MTDQAQPHFILTNCSINIDTHIKRRKHRVQEIKEADLSITGIVLQNSQIEQTVLKELELKYGISNSAEVLQSIYKMMAYSFTTLTINLDAENLFTQRDFVKIQGDGCSITISNIAKISYNGKDLMKMVKDQDMRLWELRTQRISQLINKYDRKVDLMLPENFLKHHWLKIINREMKGVDTTNSGATNISKNRNINSIPQSQKNSPEKASARNNLSVSTKQAQKMKPTRETLQKQSIPSRSKRRKAEPVIEFMGDISDESGEKAQKIDSESKTSVSISKKSMQQIAKETIEKNKRPPIIRNQVIDTLGEFQIRMDDSSSSNENYRSIKSSSQNQNLKKYKTENIKYDSRTQDSITGTSMTNSSITEGVGVEENRSKNKQSEPTGLLARLRKLKEEKKNNEEEELKKKALTKSALREHVMERHVIHENMTSSGGNEKYSNKIDRKNWKRNINSKSTDGNSTKELVTKIFKNLILPKSQKNSDKYSLKEASETAKKLDSDFDNIHKRLDSLKRKNDLIKNTHQEINSKGNIVENKAEGHKKIQDVFRPIIKAEEKNQNGVNQEENTPKPKKKRRNRAEMAEFRRMEAKRKIGKEIQLKLKKGIELTATEEGLYLEMTQNLRPVNIDASFVKEEKNDTKEIEKIKQKVTLIPQEHINQIEKQPQEKPSTPKAYGNDPKKKKPIKRGKKKISLTTGWKTKPRKKKNTKQDIAVNIDARNAEVSIQDEVKNNNPENETPSGIKDLKVGENETLSLTSQEYIEVILRKPEVQINQKDEGPIDQELRAFNGQKDSELMKPDAPALFSQKDVEVIEKENTALINEKESIAIEQKSPDLLNHLNDELISQKDVKAIKQTVPKLLNDQEIISSDSKKSKDEEDVHQKEVKNIESFVEKDVEDIKDTPLQEVLENSKDIIEKNPENIEVNVKKDAKNVEYTVKEDTQYTVDTKQKDVQNLEDIVQKDANNIDDTTMKNDSQNTVYNNQENKLIFQNFIEKDTQKAIDTEQKNVNNSNKDDNSNTTRSSNKNLNHLVVKTLEVVELTDEDITIDFDSAVESDISPVRLSLNNSLEEVSDVKFSSENINEMSEDSQYKFLDNSKNEEIENPSLLDLSRYQTSQEFIGQGESKRKKRGGKRVSFDIPDFMLPKQQNFRKKFLSRKNGENIPNINNPKQFTMLKMPKFGNKNNNLNFLGNQNFMQQPNTPQINNKTHFVTGVPKKLPLQIQKQKQYTEMNNNMIWTPESVIETAKIDNLLSVEENSNTASSDLPSIDSTEDFIPKERSEIVDDEMLGNDERSQNVEKTVSRKKWGGGDVKNLKIGKRKKRLNPPKSKR